MKPASKLLVIISLLILLFISAPLAQVSANNSIHASNNWARQSPYTALINPQIKWSMDLKGKIINLVIDSNGTLYVLVDGGMLWAIDKEGKVIWSKKIPAYSNSALTLYNDKYIIVAGNQYFGDAIISKYSSEGELLWENIYEKAKFIHNEIAIDEDGFIAVTGRFQLINEKKTTDYSISFKYEEKLIGIDSDGRTKFTHTIATDREGTLPYMNSAPVIVKSNIYLTYSEGYYRILKHGGSIPEFPKSVLYSVTKEGTKRFSTEFEGFHYSVPVYSNNNLYVIGDDNLYLFNLNGVQLMKISAPKYSVASNTNGASISSSGYMIFGAMVYSPTGKFLWGLESNAYKPMAVNSMVIDKNQKVIMSYSPGWSKNDFPGVWARDLKTGKSLWRIHTYHPLNTTPVIGKDGTIYVGGTKLFAISQK